MSAGTWPHRRLGILAGLVALGALVVLSSPALGGTAQAVTLVNPAGQPVGGKWQRWANQMKVPTVRRLTLDVSASAASEFCGAAGACSLGWEPWQARETIVAPDASRDSFYYELGHQFDWRVLNAADRRMLAREWGQPDARWQDSQASVSHHAEDGLEALFPAIYADCATGIYDNQEMSVGFMGSNYAPPAITPEGDTCRWITRIGVARHVSVHGWRRWTWTPASRQPTPVTTIG